MSTARVLKLRSSDGQLFELEEAVAAQSGTIKNMIEDFADSVIPLYNIDGATLARVIQFCRKQASNPGSGGGDDWKAMEEWKELDLDGLYDIITASHFLAVDKLLELACDRVADLIRGKTRQEIRKLFGIKNDFTREEEEDYLRKHSWAFED